jgi:hypothetical protein
VFTFANVFHFFAYELAGLSAGRFAFALVFARALNCFFFRHNKMVSPVAVGLDVAKYREAFARTGEVNTRPEFSADLQVH